MCVGNQTHNSAFTTPVLALNPALPSLIWEPDFGFVSEQFVMNLVKLFENHFINKPIYP